MVPQDSVLVMLVRLVDRIPRPPPPTRPRGRPRIYSDRLFLKALVIMIVRRLTTAYKLLSVLAEPTAEMQTLRVLLREQDRWPCRRTFERRLATLPATLPAQIGCLGRYLVAAVQPWLAYARAAAIDSTVLRARGASGTRRTAQPASSRTPPSTPRPTGRSRAGMAGCTAGSCTWSSPSRPSGSRWPRR